MNSVYQYLEEIRKQDEKKYDDLVFWDKVKTVNMLIDFLNEKYHCQYFYSLIDDVSGNSADALILNNSKIYERDLKGHDLLHYHVEQLIDNCYTDNKGEIILLDVNGMANSMNIAYLAETLEAKNTSYAKEIKEQIKAFLEFLLKKRIEMF